MICYFYQSQNKITEKKGKIKQKRIRKRLASRQGRGPPFQPAQPTRGTSLSSSPGTSTQLRARHAVAVAVAAPQPTPCLLLAARVFWRSPGHFPLLPRPPVRPPHEEQRRNRSLAGAQPCRLAAIDVEKPSQ